MDLADGTSDFSNKWLSADQTMVHSLGNGEWSKLDALLNTKRENASAMIKGDYIYLIGGTVDDTKDEAIQQSKMTCMERLPLRALTETETPIGWEEF